MRMQVCSLSLHGLLALHHMLPNCLGTVSLHIYINRNLSLYHIFLYILHRSFLSLSGIQLLENYLTYIRYCSSPNTNTIVKRCGGSRIYFYLIDQSYFSIKSHPLLLFSFCLKKEKQKESMSSMSMSSSSAPAYPPDHISSSDQLCYVHCSFCDTVLAVNLYSSLVYFLARVSHE